MNRQTFVAILSAVLALGLFLPAFAQATDRECEQCGMTVDVLGQERFKIIDGNNVRHYACCPVCALKLMQTYGELNITSFCDYGGPAFPIAIAAKQFGGVLTINPTSTVIIIGGSCDQNRIVYDSSAANALLGSPNNGTSQWLSPQTNSTVPHDAAQMSVVQAVIKYVGVTPTVEPTPNPNPTPSPEPAPEPTPDPTPDPTPEPMADTKECEACAMVVTADDEWHFKVTDGTGQTHYVECYMCALFLTKSYDKLHIESFCDWYGPNYPITVESTGYGAKVTVNPKSAMVLNAGTCDGNRVAYNQTASDALKGNYSQYTSLLQQHDWESAPDVTTVAEAIAKINPNTAKEDPATYMAALIAAVTIVGVAAGIIANRKLRK